MDQWGIPVLRFHFRWSDYELRQAQDMQPTFRSIIEAMGGTYIRPKPPSTASTLWNSRGWQNHPRSRHRAHGRQSQNFRLNGYCQAHEVKNLFVTDGASLVTNPDKNPTLTIMALSWRASEYLLDKAKKGNI